jgi:lipoprotein-anchoring transpeptidase ErfK/SrfK
MTPISEQIQSLPHKNQWTKPWILIILSISLLIAIRVTPARSFDSPILANSLASPSFAPTTTATATRASQPAATNTPAPFPTPETMVKVFGYSVNLRNGPGINYRALRKLAYDEPLILLGRLSDNTWLYVNTADGQDGWVSPDWVNLDGIHLDHYTVKTPSPSQETKIKVYGDFVNLRAGPGRHFSEVQKLTYGEALILLGRLSDNTWLYVRTLDGKEGWIKTTLVDLTGVNLYNDYHPVQTPPPTETSTPVILAGIQGNWIDIDLSEQKLYAYQGTTLMASFLVSTGIDRYPTETGQFHIYAKFRYSDMHGNDYYLPNVPYSMYYDNDFSIHGTYWHHNFGTRMSHGCINMDTRDAEWLYNRSSIGTLVNIHY